MFDTELPKNTCIIEWPDKIRARKVVKRSNARVTFKYPSIKAQRVVECESEIEKDACILLDVNPSVLTYSEQPAQIFFHFDGENRIHYPDLLVEFVNGKTFVEIKDHQNAEDNFIKARTQVLTKLLPLQGYSYLLLTDEEIRQEPRLSNAKNLLRYGRKSVDLKQTEQVRRHIKLKGFVTLGDLQSALFGIYTTSIVYRLIIDGFLHIDINEKWNESTQITISDSKV